MGNRRDISLQSLVDDEMLVGREVDKVLRADMPTKSSCMRSHSDILTT